MKSGLVLENFKVRWTSDDYTYNVLLMIHIYIKHVSFKNIILEGMKSKKIPLNSREVALRRARILSNKICLWRWPPAALRDFCICSWSAHCLPDFCQKGCKAPLFWATTAERNVLGGEDNTIDKQRELLDIHLLASACHGADNFTDLLPVRKFPIRGR